MKTNKETPEVVKLLKMQKYLEDKDELEDNLAKKIKERYPYFDVIRVSDTALDIRTKNYSIYISKWTDDWTLAVDPTPKMSCDGSMKLPDTVEQFEAMKTAMEDERQQCISVFKELFPIFFPELLIHLKQIAKTHEGGQE